MTIILHCLNKKIVKSTYCSLYVTESKCCMVLSDRWRDFPLFERENLEHFCYMAIEKFASDTWSSNKHREHGLSVNSMFTLNPTQNPCSQFLLKLQVSCEPGAWATGWNMHVLHGLHARIIEVHKYAVHLNITVENILKFYISYKIIFLGNQIVVQTDN